MEDAINNLINLFSKIPGFGYRSAKRAVLKMLSEKEEFMIPFAKVLEKVIETTVICSKCGNVDCIDPCKICEDVHRSTNIICVVETIGDLWSVEKSGTYRGVYHVLGGVLSAMEGVFPEHLNIDMLVNRTNNEDVDEVIIATNATVEGEATSHYICDLIKDKVDKVSRLAYGLPIGGEIDYLDEATLVAAFESRGKI